MPPRLPWKAALVLIAGFAAAGEFALRAARFQYPSAADRALRAPAGPYVLDPQRLWKLKAGEPLPWAPDERVNARCMRGPDVPDARSQTNLRFAVLGSDAALGAGVAWNETWPAMLAAALERSGHPTEVLVAACEGATVRMSLERWRRDVRELQPDLVFVCHAGTDELTAAALGISDEARLADPARFSIEPQRLDALRGALRMSQFADWILDIQSGAYWQWRQQSLDEQRLRAAQQTFDVKGTRRVLWSEFLEQTRILSGEIRLSGANLFLMPIPGEELLRGRSPVARGYLTVVEKLAAEEKLPALSPLSVLQSAKLPIETLVRSAALTPEGHRILAEHLASVLVPRAGELRR